MTHRFDALLALTAVARLVVPATLPAQSGALVLRNVTLIDGTGGAAGPGMTVMAVNEWKALAVVERALRARRGLRAPPGTRRARRCRAGAWPVVPVAPLPAVRHRAEYSTRRCACVSPNYRFIELF